MPPGGRNVKVFSHGPYVIRARPTTLFPMARTRGSEYLQAIEPVVDFDPATGSVADFYAADEAASEAGIELMTANGSAATYSCSEVGLKFPYFDSRSRWEAIHVIASEQAPGAVGSAGPPGRSSELHPLDRYIVFELQENEARCHGYGDVPIPSTRKWSSSPM